MPLEGLRAWIGEVERKLGKRTRVFLALCVIAIGIAGAAIYLALDARSDSVSEGDVQELQQELEAQGVGGGAELSQLEAEVRSLQAEVQRLKGNGGGSGRGEGGSNEGQGGTGAGNSGGAGGASGEEGGSDPGSSGASGGVVPEKGDPARLQELLERAKEQSEANE